MMHGLDPYEMIGEKVMACNRRQGGTAKDVYDLNLWTGRPFHAALARRVAVLKAWTDQRRSPRFDPVEFLSVIEPRNFRWTDLDGLVPRNQHNDPRAICRRVCERFNFLVDVSEAESDLLADQTTHRLRDLYDSLRAEARRWAEQVPR